MIDPHSPYPYNELPSLLVYPAPAGAKQGGPLSFGGFGTQKKNPEANASGFLKKSWQIEIT